MARESRLIDFASEIGTNTSQAALHLVRDVNRDAPAPASVVARQQTAALGELIRVALETETPTCVPQR